MASARELIDRGKSAPDTFTVNCSLEEGGDTITFRNIKDLRLINERQKRAKDYVKISEMKSVPPEWRKYLPITPEMAFVMAELTLDAIDPTFTALEALELCATNGMLASLIHMQLQIKTAESVGKGEIEAIEAEKNALAPTESIAATSPSATNRASRSIPTTSPKTTGDTPASI